MTELTPEVLAELRKLADDADVIEPLERDDLISVGISKHWRAVMHAYIIATNPTTILTLIAAAEERDRYKAQAEKAEGFLSRAGYRRCDIAACNCNSWHGGNASERLQEIRQALDCAGIEWRRTILATVEGLIERAEKAEAAYEASYTLGSEWRVRAEKAESSATELEELHDAAYRDWQTLSMALIGREHGTCGELMAALSTTAPAAPESPWRPIETAPKDEFILVTHGVGMRKVAFFDTEDGEWFYPKQGDYPYLKVTPTPHHWMPLPEPPATHQDTQQGER